MKDYSDIINLEHPTSKNHPRMNRLDRAAQFSPFAALTGYDKAIEEASRETSNKIILDENLKEILDRNLNAIILKKEENPLINIIYFIKDKTKGGGKYHSINCHIKRIDQNERVIILLNNKKISIDDILSIEIVS